MILLKQYRGGASNGSQGTDDNNVDNQYNTLRISELRKKAYEIGLNVDGSREMLIADRWK